MERSRKTRQRAGGTQLPSEYFGKSSGRYFPTGDVALKPGNTAYGEYVPKSYGVIRHTSQGMETGPNLATYPYSSNTQTGGFSSPYDTIVNPETNRKVSLSTRKGKRVLKNYLNSLQ